MKTFVQKGHTVTVIAPYAVASGAGLLLGALFGVAVNAIANGAEGEIETGGVYDLVALGTDTIDAGQRVYWDNTNKRCTETASGNYPIGVALSAKAGGVTTVRVRLDGIATAAAA